jgi:hypothetical protein
MPPQKVWVCVESNQHLIASKRADSPPPAPGNPDLLPDPHLPASYDLPSAPCAKDTFRAEWPNPFPSHHARLTVGLLSCVTSH